MTSADFKLVCNVKYILANGQLDEDPRPHYEDGTPAHTYFVNHAFRQYNLDKGEFPICTLRPIAWKSAIKEIFWIFQDQSNDLKLLEDKYNIKWWKAWMSKDYPGTIAHRYGHTISRYDIFNRRVLNDISENPYGRYHICNMWQEEELNSSDGLNPCAYETIWNVSGEYLDMVLVQRSGDMITASGAGQVNEVQYAALLMMVAKHTGYKPRMFSHLVANEQIYDRHIDAANELLRRAEENSLPISKDNPYKYEFNEVKMRFHPESDNFYDFTIDDFELVDYKPMKPQLRLDLGI